jgi:hypothetical protein
MLNANKAASEPEWRCSRRMDIDSYLGATVSSDYQSLYLYIGRIESVAIQLD